MPEFFAFDRLTWPEVAQLPRRTPLLLPFGSGYDRAEVAELFAGVERVGLLPALPFGWAGSGLAVSRYLLDALLSNLLAGLYDDGFQEVSLLVPQGLKISSALPHIPLPAAVEQANFLPDPREGKVLLAPIGHTEQHGLHLPLNTDTVIIEAIGQGTADSLPERAACLPVFPYGVSMHRRSFAGTFSCGGRAFEDFWLAVVDELAARGHQRFYLLSGHGGNCSFLQNVVKYTGEKHRNIFCATAWLYLSGPRGVEALERLRESGTGGMGHACELETALMLHLRPELVHMERAVDEMNFICTPSYYMDWIEGGALIANPPWEDDTATGAYGAGSLGSAEKGRQWLQAAIEEKAGHVLEIITQHERRTARRSV